MRMVRMGSAKAIADPGKRVVLTEHGYKQTQEGVKRERKFGEAVRGHEQTVPLSWVERGYVEED